MASRFTDFFQVKTREEVEAILIDSLKPLESETVPLPEANDRISAASLTAPESIPPFPRSTVDGYAVNSRDTFGASEGFPAMLKVSGAIPIGTLPTTPLKRGEAMEIPTGGALPQGADAVVMVEHTESPDPSIVEIYRPVSPLENVVQTGEDIREGAVVLEKGQKIRPQELGLLAALGITQVSVARKPTVGIISTGNEIVPAETSPLPGQVRDVNRFTLQGLVEQSGGEARFITLVPDDEKALKAACEAGLSNYDLLLLSGGSSVGVRDLTLKVLETFPGFSLLVHGVAVSPGKPTLVVKVGEKMVFGLPGHPVSTWVIAQLFVTRALHILLGARENSPLSWEKATLQGNIPSAQGREDFVRAKVEGKGKDKVVTPIFSKSGIISSLVAANALIRIPLNSEGVYKGEEVDILMLL
ncbi:MAG: molybdopterin molybdenumtransferase MoeA [Deltaproteobacteria bacterium]|nr:MAG: molybdopterin molybdenumtransferase MoeA [Deltaproteobacteria bacterium]